MLVALLFGLLLTAYGLWALYSGQIISTWAQTVYRPSPIYWITTLGILVLGMTNVLVAIYGVFR